VADEWAWVLCDRAGSPLPGTQRARGRRLSFVRNHADSALLTLGLLDPGTVAFFDALRNGIPQLVVYRNGGVVFSGHWEPMSGGHDVDGDSFVNLVFKSAFAQLDNRLTTYPIENYTAMDAGLIAQELITNTETNYGATNIDSSDGLYELTKDRDRSYEHKTISEAIIELTEVQGGFDWYPTYWDGRTFGSATMLFNVVGHYGTDRETAIFEFGDGTLQNCRGYSFTFTRPLNIARALGNAILSEQENADSVARYGVFMATVSATDVSEQLTLDDMALDALRPDPVMVTDFKGEPARCPLPWDDFWIGDTIRVNLDDGAIQQQLQPRVQTIEVGLDEDDNIADLTVGIDPASAGSFLSPANSTRRYIQQQRDVLRRISALER
jgi:hypothetical protein